MKLIGSYLSNVDCMDSNKEQRIIYYFHLHELNHMLVIE